MCFVFCWLYWYYASTAAGTVGLVLLVVPVDSAVRPSSRRAELMMKMMMILRRFFHKTKQCAVVDEMMCGGGRDAHAAHGRLSALPAPPALPIGSTICSSSLYPRPQKSEDHDELYL